MRSSVMIIAQMKKLIYALIVLIVGSTAMSLGSCKSAKMRNGDEAYGRGEYDAASKIYRKIYNKFTRKEERLVRGEAAYKMGLCHLRLNQSSRASAAFQNALRYEYEDSIDALFYLAQAQHMDGQWAKAIDSYEAYLQHKPGDWRATQGIRACNMAPKWQEQGSRYTVKIAKLFNTSRADFAPQFLDQNADQLYFSSSSEKAMGTAKSAITGAKNCDIFVSKKDDKGKWSRPAPVEGELNSEFDEGNTAFSPDGTTMYLAKAIRKTDAPTGVEICTSQRSEAKWSAPVKFEITGDTLSSYGDPAVSHDGKWLYFASDMPGGQGGKDIWRINIKDTRGTLENLGDQINTPGDERYPYMRTDSVMYFSSNGHAGFGGLDLFKATLQPSGRWFIENMGSPMNSSGDDFGITFGKGESGYFSSNRKDFRGYDHIFSFEKPEITVTISGLIVDKDEEPVPNAVIRIVGSDGSNQKAAANPDGTFRFNLDRGIDYVMLAGANGYLNNSQHFTSEMSDESAEYWVDFTLASMNKPQVVENIFYDFDKATLRPESKKALDELVTALTENPYVTIEMASHTDRVGNEDYNNKLSQRRAQSVVDYLIKHNINKNRLKPQGYGKSRPKVVTKRINRLYPQFAVGDTLTVAYIDTLSSENKAAADQINRRTEFMVLSTNFQPFADDLKKMQEEENRKRAAEQEARLKQEELDIAKAKKDVQEKERLARENKLKADQKKKDDETRAERKEKEDEKAEKAKKRQEKKEKERAKREAKKAKEKEKREKEKAKQQAKREKERAKRDAKRGRHDAQGSDAMPPALSQEEERGQNTLTVKPAKGDSTASDAVQPKGDKEEEKRPSTKRGSMMKEKEAQKQQEKDREKAVRSVRGNKNVKGDEQAATPSGANDKKTEKAIETGKINPTLGTIAGETGQELNTNSEKKAGGENDDEKKTD